MSDSEHPEIIAMPLEQREGRWQAKVAEHRPIATLHLPMAVDEFARAVRKLDEAFPGCVLDTASSGDIEVWPQPRGTRPMPAPALRTPAVKIRTDQ